MSFKDIISNWIVRNLLLAALFVGVIVLAFNLGLAAITRHNDHVTTPDFTNMTYEEAVRLAEASEVKVIQYDSLSVRGAKPGVVFSQTPKEGELVKRGRVISLTMNSFSSKKVTMPSLVGTSLRQAKAELSSKGLQLGRITYENDIATNHVLKQLFHNREAPAGLMIPNGSTVDLVLGLSPDAEPTFVPSVIGLKKMRAVDALQDNSLNIRKITYDESVTTYSDSAKAVVYRQTPEAGRQVALGSEISIFLTVNQDRLESKE